MKRFYYRVEDKNQGDTVEVYIGQSAGNQLSKDLACASSEVIIVSPYIDERKLDDLITLKKRNVHVRLAFSSLDANQEKSILRKLIRQKQIKNHTAAAQAKQSMRRYAIVSTIFLVAAVVFLTNLYFHFRWSYLSLGILLGVFSFYFNWKRKQAAQLPIYTYEYEETINFKYLRTTGYGGNTAPFVHSKIYIIDRKIAYLGSVNFTSKGFESNFETRIRITNTAKIQELISFVNQLLDARNYLNCHQTSWLGKRIYREYDY